MERRVIVAFAVAPAIVPLAVITWALRSEVHLRESIVLGSIYGAFTYGASLLFGVPLFLTLSGHGWTRWWQYAIAGALVGVCVWLLILAAAQRAFFDWRTIGVFAGAGVISTTGFWLVANSGSRG